MGTVTPIRPGPASPTSRAAAPSGPTGRAAIAAWVDYLRQVRTRGGAYTSPSTVRNYMLAAAAVIPGDASIAELDTPGGAAGLADAVRQRWGSAAASTLNAKRSALRSFLAYCRDQSWLSGDPLAGLAREHQLPPVQRARSRAEIHRLLREARHPLRDRALWALMYESTARVAELLSLDVPRLDLPNSRARTTLKGGAVHWVTWNRGGLAARLLARLVAGRRTGPVFLTRRAAKGAGNGTVRPADLDPETGRGRYGYDAALKYLKASAGGWTPHDIRHSALTHYAEDGMDVTLLMAKSGHLDIRSVGRYARPSAEAAQRAAEQIADQRER